MGKLHCARKCHTKLRTKSKETFFNQVYFYYSLPECLILHVTGKLKCSSLQWYQICNGAMSLDLSTSTRMRQSHKPNVPKLAMLCYCENKHIATAMKTSKTTYWSQSTLLRQELSSVTNNDLKAAWHLLLQSGLVIMVVRRWGIFFH